jgi:hypothetical protein
MAVLDAKKTYNIILITFDLTKCFLAFLLIKTPK